MQAELEVWAVSREISCEQVVYEAVGDYLQRVKYSSPEYDAWFTARYEEGKAALECGDVCSHEEVCQDMAKRRERYLKMPERA